MVKSLKIISIANWVVAVVYLAVMLLGWSLEFFPELKEIEGLVEVFCTFGDVMMLRYPIILTVASLAVILFAKRRCDDQKPLIKKAWISLIAQVIVVSLYVVTLLYVLLWIVSGI